VTPAPRHSEAAFETDIEAQHHRNGQMPVARERAIALLREHRDTYIAAASGHLNMGQFPA
jgi:hypothetical protein